MTLDPRSPSATDQSRAVLPATRREAPRPLDEAERLRSVLSLSVLDTAPEPIFDWLAGLTANQLQAPVAIISLVDEERVWFKAIIGRDGAAAPRAGSLCDWVVSGAGFFEVPDESADPRFADGAMAAVGLASYAGTPIFGVDGQAVGSLCVLDTRPRVLSPAERERLERMAEMVTGQLHVRQSRAAATEPKRAPATTSRAAEGSEDTASTDLRHAMNTGAILPYYQPIVSMVDGKTVGCEALARWEHPTQGVLTPAAFLEIAERDSLIVDLDHKILDRTCRQIARWWEDVEIPRRPDLSLNISGRHLASHELVDDVRAVLEGNGLPGDALTLEVSEFVLSGADDAAVTSLTRLRDLGVSLTLDDFGTAQSSINYLHRFPVNGLKVHHDFVAGLGAGSRNQSMVEAILRLAKRLDMDVIAVGVETAAQAAILRELGCPKAQGYLYAPALPADQMRLRIAY